MDQQTQADGAVPQHPLRRASDLKPPTNPSNADLFNEIRAVRSAVSNVESAMGLMKDAFVLNDLGKPDYEGHRSAHRSMIEAQKALAGYKVDMTKKVLSWAAGGLFLLFTTGAHEHIKKWLGN